MASWGVGHRDVFFGSGCSSLFSMCLGWSCVSCCFWFYFSNLVWFLRSSISLSLSVDVCFVVEGRLVGDFPRKQCCVWAGCSNSNFFKRVNGFSWMFVLPVFLNVKLLDRWCWCFPWHDLHNISWSFLELLRAFAPLLVRVYILDSWTFWISVVAPDNW